MPCAAGSSRSVFVLAQSQSQSHKKLILIAYDKNINFEITLVEYDHLTRRKKLRRTRASKTLSTQNPRKYMKMFLKDPTKADYTEKVLLPAVSLDVGG